MLSLESFLGGLKVVHDQQRLTSFFLVIKLGPLRLDDETGLLQNADVLLHARQAHVELLG